MQSFAALSEQDRWALAFHSASIAYGDADAGERLWESDSQVRALIPDLAALVALTPAELEAKLGPGRAAAVTAFLRSSPEALDQSSGANASLQLARQRRGGHRTGVPGERGQDRQAAPQCGDVAAAVHHPLQDVWNFRRKNSNRPYALPAQPCAMGVCKRCR